MRAVVLRDRQMVLRDDVPEPVPGPGQVLVGVTACGICGSDLHFAKHGETMLELGQQMQGSSHGDQKTDLSGDIFMGHEFSAEVLEAGPDTEAPKPGTIVTSLPVLLSSTGVEPIFSSNTTIGGYAERMLLSAPLLLTVPNGLDPRHAALTEPMAVGLHAVNKSAIRAGRGVVGARLRADRPRDHRRAAPPRSGNALWRRIFRGFDANWPRRWARTRPSIRPRVRRSTP